MNKLKESLDHRLSMTQWTADNTQKVLSKIRKEDCEMKKTVSTIFIAAIIMIIVTTTVVLAETQWGVLNWIFDSSTSPTAPIETVAPTVLENTGPEGVTVYPMEAVSDGYGLYLSVVCTPKDKSTLLLNAAFDPNQDFASDIGVDPAYDGQTIAEWAKTQGYSSISSIHLFSNAYSVKLETFDSSVSATMRLLDDGSSLIMLAGSCLEGDDTYELSYEVIPYIASKGELPTQTAWMLSTPSEFAFGTIRFTIQKREGQSAKKLASYEPVEKDTAGSVRIKRVDLLQSQFASYILVTYTLMSDQNQEEMMPIFASSMQLDGNGPLSWPNLLMHGRKKQQLPDGEMEYAYYYTRTINYLPDEFEVQGVCIDIYDVEKVTEIPPVHMIREGQ